jgi:hypothetical protein
VLMAVAKALGVTFTAVEADPHKSATWYHDSKWRFESVQYGRDMLRRLMAEHVLLPPTKAEAA